MGDLYNRESQTPRRQHLRNDAPATERLLWQFLKEGQLGKKFRRQFGVSVYVLDFYCPEVRLAVELDGESHDTEEATSYDKDRDRYLTSIGIRILRFRNDDVYDDPDKVIDTIKHALYAPLPL